MNPSETQNEDATPAVNHGESVNEGNRRCSRANISTGGEGRDKVNAGA